VKPLNLANALQPRYKVIDGIQWQLVGKMRITPTDPKWFGIRVAEIKPNTVAILILRQSLLIHSQYFAVVKLKIEFVVRKRAQWAEAGLEHASDHSQDRRLSEPIRTMDDRNPFIHIQWNDVVEDAEQSMRTDFLKSHLVVLLPVDWQITFLHFPECRPQFQPTTLHLLQIRSLSANQHG